MQGHCSKVSSQISIRNPQTPLLCLDPEGSHRLQEHDSMFLGLGSAHAFFTVDDSEQLGLPASGEAPGTK